MRFIDPDIVDACVPPKWKADALNWQQQVERADDKSGCIGGIGNKWSELKKPFVASFGDKCWYTEAPRIGTDNDVDHFRPKAGVKNAGGEVTRDVAGVETPHGGYWWLAYIPANYRYSCVYANRLRAGGGKGEYFPISDEEYRCFAEEDPIENEQPVLLDPCIRSDVELLAYDYDLGKVASKLAEDEDAVGFQRVKLSDGYYNLNEQSIVSARRTHLTGIRSSIHLLRLADSLSEEQLALAGLEEGMNQARDSLIEATSRSAPFSAASVSLIRCCRAEPWIQNVLHRFDFTA